MGLHDPFGHLKHKLWPKEESGVKLPIWLPNIKSQESPQFPYMQVTCDILLERSWQGVKLFLDLTSIEGLHTKLWAPKVVRVLTLEILGLSFGNPETKWHLGDGPMAKQKVYYKGEGGGFAQVQAVVNFVSPCLLVVRSCLLVAHPCTKVLQFRINQLIV